MRKHTLIAMLALATVPVGARTTLDVKGVTYNVDTTFHAKVGPGTTQTDLRMSDGTNPLLVHYLTIDRSVPGVSIRAVCAKDMVAGTARTSAMAESRTRDGLDYFAGVNGDFFTTSGNATNGSSKVGTPTTSCIVDGEIYKSSTANYQFSVDADGTARICRFNYYTGTATIGDKVTLFKGVNVMSPNNGITIYTPRFWGSANQNDYAGSCNQVTARIVDGDEFVAGGKFRLEVTSEPATDGDMVIPADGFVIHGRGTSKTGCNTGASDFVGALHAGDIVEFDNIILTPEGERIYPRTVVSGNPRNVGGGLTLDTEGERADASARHPRTCIGYSEDGSKIIMMVIDGRIGASVGVTTSMLADVMRFAGAYEAVNLDGGGSSTLYTHALGIRNNCSDGSERSVGNAVFAVLEAPEDNEVASISFADWRKDVPMYGEYRPVIYAYNKYGKMIDSDYKDFELVAEAALGDITDDSRGIVAYGEGSHRLTAKAAGGAEAYIVVSVTGQSEVRATLPSVLLNATRQWTVQLESDVDDKTMSVSPLAFEWTSTDSGVATVTADGTVQGVADGVCTVTGKRGDFAVPVQVTVEVPRDVYHNVEPQPVADNWTVTGNSAKVSAFGANADHSYSIDYTLSSTRGPKVTMAQKINLWSHPQAVVACVNPGDAKVTGITLTVRANDNTRVATSTVTAIEAGEAQYSFPLADILGSDDVAVYPIEFNSLAFNLGGSVSTPYHIDVTSLRAQYDGSTVDVVDLRTDCPEGFPFAIAADGSIGFNSIATDVTVCDLAGRVVLRATDVGGVTVPSPGVYVISATFADGVHTAKVRL